MQSPAVLSAEEVVAARLGGLEPLRGVTAGNYVHLHAKGGDEKIVNHVFRGHGKPDGDIYGDVQLVDFALPFRMLQVPHPLLADDKNFDSSLVPARRAKKETRPP